MYDPLMLVIHAFVIIGIIVIGVRVFKNSSKLDKKRDSDIKECQVNLAHLRSRIAELEEFNKLLMMNTRTSWEIMEEKHKKKS